MCRTRGTVLPLLYFVYILAVAIEAAEWPSSVNAGAGEAWNGGVLRADGKYLVDADNRSVIFHGELCCKLLHGLSFDRDVLS